MDFENVNNPFVTFKNLSTEEEFTVDLSKPVPNVDNDPSMSNLKKSNHKLYSDNRAEKTKVSDELGAFGNFSITLLDIDNIIYEYFTKVINPQVVGENNTLVSVPVRHASPERWSAIQSDGVYRDEKGQLQRPMIVFTRTGVSKDESFVTFNKYLSVPFVKKYSNKNSYDRFSLLNNAHPLAEVHNVTFPDHVVLTYEFNMSTEYVQQMNSLVETINFAEGDYWGDPTRLKFRASIDSFTNSVEVPSDDDRSVSTSFTLTVNAYLLPRVFDNKTTVQRTLGTRKVKFGLEAINTYDTIVPSKKEMALKIKQKLNETSKNLLLNRKTKKIYITDDEVGEFNIRIWPDEEIYTLNVSGRNFNLKLESDGSLIWDYLSENKKLESNEYFITTIGDTKKIKIKSYEKNELIKIVYQD